MSDERLVTIGLFLLALGAGMSFAYNMGFKRGIDYLTSIMDHMLKERVAKLRELQRMQSPPDE